MAITGLGLGKMRTAQVDTGMVTDIVPADMAVNALIVVAWETSLKR
jgi:hypothetical protein